MSQYMHWHSNYHHWVKLAAAHIYLFCCPRARNWTTELTPIVWWWFHATIITIIIMKIIYWSVQQPHRHTQHTHTHKSRDKYCAGICDTNRWPIVCIAQASAAAVSAIMSSIVQICSRIKNVCQPTNQKNIYIYRNGNNTALNHENNYNVIQFVICIHFLFLFVSSAECPSIWQCCHWSKAVNWQSSSTNGGSIERNASRQTNRMHRVTNCHWAMWPAYSSYSSADCWCRCWLRC